MRSSQLARQRPMPYSRMSLPQLPIVPATITPSREKVLSTEATTPPAITKACKPDWSINVPIATAK